MSASGVPGAMAAGQRQALGLGAQAQRQRQPAAGRGADHGDVARLVVGEQRLVDGHDVVVGGGKRMVRRHAVVDSIDLVAAEAGGEDRLERAGLAGIVDEAAAVDGEDHLARVCGGDGLRLDEEGLDPAERRRLAGHAELFAQGRQLGRALGGELRHQGMPCLPGLGIGIPVRRAIGRGDQRLELRARGGRHRDDAAGHGARAGLRIVLAQHVREGGEVVSEHHGIVADGGEGGRAGGLTSSARACVAIRSAAAPSTEASDRRIMACSRATLVLMPQQR